MSKPSLFRPDIEGLRAVAVLLVVACHAGVPWLQGGYIGVDVFFVISGYLITRLMYAEHVQQGRLDLLRFYARRIRRLLPAFALMLVVVLAGVRLLYSPIEQPALLESAFASVLYFSNLHFAWGATDYWGPNAKLDPLLHTWSLGVEEQFYLVWPLLLVLLMFLQRRARPALVWGGAVMVLLLSLGLAVLLTHTRQPLAFFMPLPRVWEFGAGAILALMEARRAGRLDLGAPFSAGLAMAGLLALLLAAFLYTGTTTFPGLTALLPVLGTVAVITGGSASGGTGLKLLTLAPMQQLGRLSYGWYLWHWPLLVFGKVIWPDPSPLLRLVLVALALGLAATSYWLVENPVRHAIRFRSKGFALALVTAMPLLFVSSIFWMHGSANTWAGQPEFRQFAEVRGDAPWIYRAGCDRWFDDAVVVACEGGAEAGKKTAVLLGDSHAGQWFSAFDGALKAEGWKFIVMTKSACAIVNEPYFYERIGRIYRECDEWRAGALREIGIIKPDLLIVTGSEKYPFTARQWQAGTATALGSLARSAHKVVILRNTPYPGVDVPACLARRHWQPALFSSSCLYRVEDGGLSPDLMRMHQDFAAKFANVKFIDMTPAVCGGEICDVVADGVIKFRDTQHLSDAFARSMAPQVRSMLTANDLL